MVDFDLGLAFRQYLEHRCRCPCSPFLVNNLNIYSSTHSPKLNKYLIKNSVIGKLYDVYEHSDYKKLYETLKENGIRTHIRKKISEDAEEIPEAIRQGHIAYVINTSDISSSDEQKDGYEIRCLAVETNTTMFTSLDTVKVLLDVLEDITITISTIDS